MPVVSDLELNRRQAEIIEGARRCFAEHGYEGATVRLLEKATGKSRGAIFHHFADKESLFLAIAQQDAERQAEVVAESGLIAVMRDILAHPERHDWLSTRLEIATISRTDPRFRAKWVAHQQALDQAVHDRLTSLAAAGRVRNDVSPDVLHLLLDTVLFGLISHLASGKDSSTADLSAMLDLVETSIRTP